MRVPPMCVTCPFRPLPWLSNRHVQTLLGKLLPGAFLGPRSQERHVILADGDRLVLHDSAPPHWTTGQPVALLVHGLGGTHRSGYMRRFGRQLLRRGLRVVRMDLRGCGRGLTLARRTYHGGCSDDVRAAARAMQHWWP